MSIESMAQEVNELESNIEAMRDRIAALFNDNQSRFVESKNVQTPEIQDNYKKIDSIFGAKAKLEAKVLDLKKEIMKTVLENKNG